MVAEVPDNIRQELIRLCSESRSRKSIFSREAPTHWAPWQLVDPSTSEAFTVDGAWEFVHRQLNEGCGLAVVDLEKPPGKRGYWFHCYDAKGTRIYVKLQLGSGVVIGRSFHEG